jgi:hypothetical protein
MNRRHIILGVLLLFIILMGVWFWPSAKQTSQGTDLTQMQSQTSLTQTHAAATYPESSSSAVQQQHAQNQQEKHKQVIAEIITSLNTSITFYGKVIDQHGDPVPDANIKYGTIDKFDANGSHYQGKSDADGNFSVSGIKGAVLTVGVWKEGYYNIDDKSDGAFAYGIGPDSTRRLPPSKDKPAIFVLQKMGETMALLVRGVSMSIRKDGTPIEISLETGRSMATSQRDLKVEVWTNDQTKNDQGHYNWKCRISIPGGGLVERTGQFNFEAPTDGYKSSDEIVMSQSAARWSPQASREYFIKLSDNHYARINFQMIANGDHFFSITSYLNPTPGSRNLEYDPEKKVPVP